MKFFILTLITILSITYIFGIIPNWNITNTGKDLFSSENNYKYITTYKIDNTELKMVREIFRENNKINYKNYIIYGDKNIDVSFNLIGDIYNLNNHIIICPKGPYHPLNLSISPPYEVIPSGFPAQKLKYWDLKCNVRNSFIDNEGDKADFFLLFYLMTDKNYYFFRVVRETQFGSFNKFCDELYDYRINQKYLDSKPGEFSMMTLMKNKGQLLLQGKIAVLKNTKSIYDNGCTKVEISQEKTNIQSYFDIKTDSYYFILYNDIDDFTSGYYLTEKTDITHNDMEGFTPNINNISPFEFLEDELIIEEMNFIFNNRFVHYKITSKEDKNKIYYGILDIVNNKIVFNTDEKITNFFPLSAISMLAITPNTAYEICIYKDSNGNCLEGCPDNKYKLDVDGNICSSSDNCSNNKIMFMPNQICIERDKCDTNIYIIQNEQCGLCRDLSSDGKLYKLVNGTECLDYDNNTMDFFSEKLKLLKCKDGFRLESNRCVIDKNCYELCKEGQCNEFSTDINNQSCTECKEQYFLNNGNCIKTCPEGYEANNSSKKCIQCNDTNCVLFTINTCNCSKCQESYFINGTNSCEKCLDNCKSCSNSTQCEKCDDGYLIGSNGSCIPCPLDNCKKTKDDNCQCNICNDGYFLDSVENNNHKECHKCDESCKTCEINSKHCLSCKNSSYFINIANNECNLCSENCLTCSINEDNCTSCLKGQILTDEKKCSNCSEKCLTCDSIPNNNSDNCLSCNPETIYKYLVNDTNTNNRTCVENCTEIGKVLSEDGTCKEIKNENSEEKIEKNTNIVIYVFMGIIGVFMMIILICIFKKWCCEKADNSFYEEMINEMNEKEAIN